MGFALALMILTCGMGDDRRTAQAIHKYIIERK